MSLTKEWLQNFINKDGSIYYGTPSLNDCLYLNYKGFLKIENLEDFVNLKVLYLEGNNLTKIENLETFDNISCLYLHENRI